MQLKQISILFVLCTAACDSEHRAECEQLAEHVTKVLVQEKGTEVPEEATTKAAKDIVNSCTKDPPSATVLSCAMQAQTRAALLACDASSA